MNYAELNSRWKSTEHSSTPSFLYVRKIKLSQPNLKNSNIFCPKGKKPMSTDHSGIHFAACNESKNITKLPKIATNRLSSNIIVSRRQDPLFSSFGTSIAEHEDGNRGNRKLVQTISWTKSDNESSNEKSKCIVAESNVAETPRISSATEVNITPRDEHSISRPIKSDHHCRVVWYMESSMKSKYSDWIHKFQQLAHGFYLFASLQECVDFFKDHISGKTLLILSSSDVNSLAKFPRDILCDLYAIFIHCNSSTETKTWNRHLTNVRGVFTNIDDIFRQVEEENSQRICDSLITLSISTERDRLDSSFMYTLLLKEILLGMQNDHQAKTELIECFRDSNIGNPSRLSIIDEFEKKYKNYSPVWWYSRDCFISEMINTALRSLDISVIVRTRLFVRDLSKRIESLYRPPSESLTLYRGQGLSYNDFRRLQTLQNGLYSFHCFLSTSADQAVAVAFAESARGNCNRVGVVFQVNIDPNSLKSACFASISEESYFAAEDEFLFTMHTVFRVGKVQQFGENLWKVELFITNDADEDLMRITRNIREATRGSTGWNQLLKLLLTMGQIEKAEETVPVLIDKVSTIEAEEQADLYHLMGLQKLKSHFYDDAFVLFRNALQIYETLPNSNELHRSFLYNRIGLIYMHRKQLSNALNYFTKALDVQMQTDSPNELHLLSTYGNLMEVCKRMEDHVQLSYFGLEKLKIVEKWVPHDYRALLRCYEDLGESHYNMDFYDDALKFFESALDVYHHDPVENHLQLIVIHMNLGKVFDAMKDHQVALSHYLYARSTLRTLDARNASLLTTISHRIADVYRKTREPHRALKFYRETLLYLEKSVDPKDTMLAETYFNIGQMCEFTDQYNEAFNYYRQAIQTEAVLPSKSNARLDLYRQHLIGAKEKIQRKCQHG